MFCHLQLSSLSCHTEVFQVLPSFSPSRMRYPQHFPDEAEARQLQGAIAGMIGHTLHSVSRARLRSRKQPSRAWMESSSDSDSDDNWSDSDDSGSDSDNHLNTDVNCTM